MNKPTEALKLAEEALNRVINDWVSPDDMPFEDGEMPALDNAREAIAAIRDALAEHDHIAGAGKKVSDHIADAGKVMAEHVNQEPITIGNALRQSGLDVYERAGDLAFMVAVTKFSSLVQPVKQETVFDVDQMVNRFLGWKLPKDFAPDCGIEFHRIGKPNQPHYGRLAYEPVGTNLFTADQAKAMFEYCLQGLAKPVKQKPVGYLFRYPFPYSSIGPKFSKHKHSAEWEPVYAAPVERPWVDLTDDELLSIVSGYDFHGYLYRVINVVSKAISAFKEKNT